MPRGCGLAGQKDHIRAALDLFVDFAAIFARLLALLMRRKQQGSASRRERDARNRLYRNAHSDNPYAHRS